MQDSNDHMWPRRRFLSAGVLAVGAMFVPSGLIRAVESGGTKVARRELWAMGGWNYLEVTAESSQVAAAAINAMIDAIREIDRLFSVHDARSPLSRFNSAPARSVAIDDPLVLASVEKCLRCATDLGGVFDPTVEPLMQRYGFRDDQPSPTGRVPAHGRDWDYRMIKCDMRDARITRESIDIQLDCGGWAKGLAAQHAIGAAVKIGVSQAQVSCGGDIFRYDASGLSAWDCAIRDPLKGRTESAVRVRNRYPTVATSGNCETMRMSPSGQKLGHLMDPRTGAPAESDLLSVSVFGHDGLTVDAVSSALFVMGKSDALRWLAVNPTYGAVFIDRTWPMSADGITVVGALELI